MDFGTDFTEMRTSMCGSAPWYWPCLRYSWPESTTFSSSEERGCALKDPLKNPPGWCVSLFFPLRPEILFGRGGYIRKTDIQGGLNRFFQCGQGVQLAARFKVVHGRFTKPFLFER